MSKNNTSSFISIDKTKTGMNKDQSPEKFKRKTRSKSRGKRTKSEEKSQDKNKSGAFDKTKSGTMIIADPLSRIKALKKKRKPKKANPSDED